MSAQVIGQIVEDPKVERWEQFIDNMRNQVKEVQNPYKPVATFIEKYLKAEPTGSILDIGCELGKNAVALIKAGSTVTLLDIAPNAIHYTQETIQRLGLEHGVVESIVTKIEMLDPKYGPYKAVVGTFAFSFIPPDLFEKVMKNNVLGRVKLGGYFVGGFFGEKHAWAKDPTLSILTIEKLDKLFIAMGFSICEKKEVIEDIKTVQDGQQTFHTISMIAQRVLENVK